MTSRNGFRQSIPGFLVTQPNMKETSSPVVLASAGAGAGALSALQRLLVGLFDIAAPEPSAAPGGVEFSVHVTRQFILSDVRAQSLRLARPVVAGARGPAEAFGFRLQLSGEVKGETGDRAVALGPGDILFFDLQQSLDLRIEAGPDGARDVCLWVPRPRMLAAFGRDDVLHGLVLSGASPAGAMIGGGLRVLAEQAQHFSVQDMNALCDGLIALTAKALGPDLVSVGAAGVSQAAAFVTIRRYIDRNIRSPGLDADQLAKTFGVSRASLYRLFEPAGGVAGYIRKARLNRAYQEIVASETSGRRIGPIVYSLGFRNVSAFNRAFKEHYGMSPREARQRAMIAAPALPHVAPEPEDDPTRTLRFWLARITEPHAGEEAK